MRYRDLRRSYTSQIKIKSKTKIKIKLEIEIKIKIKIKRFRAARGSLLLRQKYPKPLLLTLADAIEPQRCPALLAANGTVPKLASLRCAQTWAPFLPFRLRCSASFKSWKINGNGNGNGNGKANSQ